MGERHQVLTTCKSCHGGCGVIATVEDGVVVHIQGNPDSLTKGTMCCQGALEHPAHRQPVSHQVSDETHRAQG